MHLNIQYTAPGSLYVCRCASHVFPFFQAVFPSVFAMQNWSFHFTICSYIRRLFPYITCEFSPVFRLCSTVRNPCVSPWVPCGFLYLFLYNIYSRLVFPFVLKFAVCFLYFSVSCVPFSWRPIMRSTLVSPCVSRELPAFRVSSDIL